MNEKMPSEGEQFNDIIQDDFDFGDADTEAHTIQAIEHNRSNKKLLGSIFLVVVLVMGIMGYRFFSHAKPASTLISKETPIADKPPLTQTQPSPSPSTQHTPSEMGSHPPASSGDVNFNDIAQAFSSADHGAPTPTPVQQTPPAPREATKAEPTINEGTIHDLQKELFSPEKLPSSITPTTTSDQGISSTDSAQLSQNLNKLNLQIEYITNQIKHLDSYTREISDNLNKLNDAISAMDNRIATVTNATSVLSKDVGSVRSEVGQVKSVLQEDGLDLKPDKITSKSKSTGGSEGKITIEEPEYTVHAVIPGRAWLKSSKGQIVTVAEGDAIGNYGKILVIDAANGVVLTSSGVAFR